MEIKIKKKRSFQCDSSVNHKKGTKVWQSCNVAVTGDNKLTDRRTRPLFVLLIVALLPFGDLTGSQTSSLSGDETKMQN